jgi:hypothetical protein
LRWLQLPYECPLLYVPSQSVLAENQIDTLVEEGVDGLLFETYYDLEELTNIVTTTRRKYDRFDFQRDTEWWTKAIPLAVNF